MGIDWRSRFSVKTIRYIRRKQDTKEFTELKEMIQEANAIFSEMCEDFLIEDDKLKRVSRKRIDQTKEEADGEDGIPVGGKESITQGTFICNFFVLPIERLRVFDKERQAFVEVGLSIHVYTRINYKTYKCVELDLLNDIMANSKWIDPNFLDYDYYLYKEALYAYLLRAIRLSTRLMDEDDESVFFDDGVGWVDQYFGRTDSGYIHYMKDWQIYKWKESEEEKIKLDPMTYRAMVLLKTIRELIDKSQFLKIDDYSKLQENTIGWEDDSKWAIDYKIVRDYSKEEIKKTGNFKIDKKIYKFLFEKGILAIEGSEDDFRPDTKFGMKNIRGFVLDKARFQEFIAEYEALV